MNLTELRIELDTGHPDTGAYNIDSQLAANELNLENRTESVPTIPGTAILIATDDEEYGDLTAEQQTRWLTLCGIDFIDVTSGVAKSLEAELFGQGTNTRTNLLALKVKPASRAIELGLGKVRATHVEQARAL